MFTLATFTTFLGWCTVINFGIFLVSAFAVLVLKDPVSKIHSKMVGVEQDKILIIYFQYLGNLKIAIIVFNLVPYLALKVML